MRQPGRLIIFLVKMPEARRRPSIEHDIKELGGRWLPSLILPESANLRFGVTKAKILTVTCGRATGKTRSIRTGTQKHGVVSRTGETDITCSDAFTMQNSDTSDFLFLNLRCQLR